MVVLLPSQTIDQILQKFPCREAPVRELLTYYNSIYPSPSCVVVYGNQQSKKAELISSVLDARSIRHVTIRSRDCLSQRHLLSKIFSSCVTAVNEDGNITNYDKINSISALLVNLERLLRRADERLVLVIDGIDKQKGAGPTLLPALARLGDQIRQLSIIMTSSSPRPLILHKSGVPYIHIKPYTRLEAIQAVVRDPPKLYPRPIPSTASKFDDEEVSKIFAQFAVTVYDSIVAHTSSTSISTFRSLCEKLWPRFVWPLFSGELPPGKAKKWDFTRLLIRNRSMFQTEAEEALTERLSKKSSLKRTFDDMQNDDASEPQPQARNSLDMTVGNITSTTTTLSSLKNNQTLPPLLKHFPTLLLLSSYLASHTSPKHDIILFSRLSSSSTNKKVRRSIQHKKARLFQSPSSSKSTTNNNTPSNSGPNGSEGGSRTTGILKEPKTPTKAIRNLFESKMNIARPFGMERVIAILRAIHPQGVANRRGVSDRVYRELGELERLRLVCRVNGSEGRGGAGAGGGNDDGGGGGGEKWRVNVGREWVVNMGKVWDINVQEYEIQQD